MLIKTNPLSDENEHKLIVEFLLRNINDINTNKFITSSLMNYSVETIEMVTKFNVEHNIELYLVKEENNIVCLCNIEKNEIMGFELVILLTDINYRKKGIGQKVLNELMIMAKKEKYKEIKTYVFADNKNMLTLLLKNDFVIAKFEPCIRADNIGRVELKKSLI